MPAPPEPASAPWPSSRPPPRSGRVRRSLRVGPEAGRRGGISSTPPGKLPPGLTPASETRPAPVRRPGRWRLKATDAGAAPPPDPPGQPPGGSPKDARDRSRAAADRCGQEAQNRNIVKVRAAWRAGQGLCPSRHSGAPRARRKSGAAVGASGSRAPRSNTGMTGKRPRLLCRRSESSSIAPPVAIDHIDLSRIDLNLLVALDALLDERSVTRAAARVGIGQSAMSSSLARLRRLFDDELLTRAPDGMRPTPAPSRSPSRCGPPSGRCRRWCIGRSGSTRPPSSAASR